MQIVKTIQRLANIQLNKCGGLESWEAGKLGGRKAGRPESWEAIRLRLGN
jgi:hypothetical protein